MKSVQSVSDFNIIKSEKMKKKIMNFMLLMALVLSFAGCSSDTACRFT